MISLNVAWWSSSYPSDSIALHHVPSNLSTETLRHRSVPFLFELPTAGFTHDVSFDFTIDQSRGVHPTGHTWDSLEMGELTVVLEVIQDVLLSFDDIDLTSHLCLKKSSDLSLSPALSPHSILEIALLFFVLV